MYICSIFNQNLLVSGLTFSYIHDTKGYSATSAEEQKWCLPSIRQRALYQLMIIGPLGWPPQIACLSGFIIYNYIGFIIYSYIGYICLAFLHQCTFKCVLKVPAVQKQRGATFRCAVRQRGVDREAFTTRVLMIEMTAPETEREGNWQLGRSSGRWTKAVYLYFFFFPPIFSLL